MELEIQPIINSIQSSLQEITKTNIGIWIGYSVTILKDYALPIALATLAILGTIFYYRYYYAPSLTKHQKVDESSEAQKTSTISSKDNLISSSKRINPPTFKPLSRPRYKDFVSYKKERESKDEPVDLIIGRGTHTNASIPLLVNERYVMESNVIKGYSPFTVDVEESLQPDYCASILDVDGMKYFADESVDDIYLERIYPTSTLKDIKVFVNAARILKIGGTLVADFNDGIKSDAHDKHIAVLKEIFLEFGFPMFFSIESQNSAVRNDLKDFKKFICTKGMEFDPQLMGSIDKINRRMKILFSTP